MKIIDYSGSHQDHLCLAPIHTWKFVGIPNRHPKHDDNVCSKVFQSEEQNNFRSCCPLGFRVMFSATTDRDLTTILRTNNFGISIDNSFFRFYI